MFSPPPGQPPRNLQQQLAENAHTMIEMWPIILSTAGGMARQAEDAGYPAHLSHAIALAVLGVPVHFTPDDFREMSK